MLRIAIVFICIAISITLQAQPGDPGGDPGVPITGIEILIGIGAMFGLKKIAAGRKKR